MNTPRIHRSSRLARRGIIPVLEVAAIVAIVVGAMHVTLVPMDNRSLLRYAMPAPLEPQRMITPRPMIIVDEMPLAQLRGTPGARGPDDILYATRFHEVQRVAPVKASSMLQPQLVAMPDSNVLLDSTYLGVLLWLVNPNEEPIDFQMMNTSIGIYLEALYVDGTWSAIERIQPGGWCGNSYHVRYLGPHNHWRLVAPRYAGSFRTRLRFALGRPSTANSPATMIYSNEFAGSVNPGQFTVRLGSGGRRNLMDPY